MIGPRALTIDHGWNDTDFTGAPLIESVLRAFVGSCQACGRAAFEQSRGSVLVNPLELEGTLYGDAFCVDCYDGDAEGPVFVLPPLSAAELEWEGGEAENDDDQK